LIGANQNIKAGLQNMCQWVAFIAGQSLLEIYSPPPNKFFVKFLLSWNLLSEWDGL